MLELVGTSLSIERPKRDPLPILNQVSFTAPSGHLMAVLGPTQSGKTSLIKILSRQIRANQGVILWHGQDLTRQPMHVNDIGFVPKEDDVLHDMLTVQENIVSAMMLRMTRLTKDGVIEKVSRVMLDTGIELVSSHRAGTLTLLQRRRLKLAIALVTAPPMILCDEFTEGLDAKSERELVALLHSISRSDPNRIVINATQSMSNLGSYDAVLVMNEGNVCFHGPARALPHYFSVKQLDEIYPRMAKRPAHRWGESWRKHRDTYYAAFKLGGDTEKLAPASEADENLGDLQTEVYNKGQDKEAEAEESPLRPAPGLPSAMTQISHLLKRRWTVFKRTKREWLTHSVLLFGGPLLAVLLMARAKVHFTESSGTVTEVFAYAVSMAIAVQVLLLLFMGVYQSSGEIADERALFERERQGGLRSGSYLLGKLLYLAPICLAQGAWMALFADMVTGGLPGHALVRLGLFMAVTFEATTLGLGISAIVRSGDRARSICFGLLLAQIPFSGLLLALPSGLGGVIHPLIPFHAAWAGALETVRQNGFMAAFDRLNGTWLMTPGQAFAVLGVHILIGIALTMFGLRAAKVR